MFAFGYKFFELKDGNPRSLVHGMLQDGKRSRMYPVGTFVKKEPGTPGFNLFLTKEAALNYLPRFRVRKDRLVLCRVSYALEGLTQSKNYALAQEIMIFTKDWRNALLGHFNS